MANFFLTIPDELLPALTAEFLIVSTGGGTQAASVEEYFAASVVEIIRQRAEIYKVGPYFEGAVEPRFLADGMPNPAYQGADAIVLPEPEEGLDPEIEEDPVDDDSDTTAEEV
jgi:hypothetical protein